MAIGDTLLDGRPSADATWDGWREALRLAWKTYLPMRLMLIALGVVVGIARPPDGPIHGLGAWLEQLFLAPWNQYDVRWYVKIASDGYAISDGRAVFHPLLPLLMGLLGRVLGGQYVLAGLIINDIACVGALAALYRLFALDHDPAVAREAMYWLLHIPLGFVMLLPYTESLTLWLILLAFWFARHDRWLAVGLCGFLAALAKQPAIVLAPVLFIDYAYRHRRRLLRWPTVKVAACLSLIPLGYLSFSIYRILLAQRLAPAGGQGSALSSLALSDDLSAIWGSGLGWPWQVLARIARFSVGPYTDWVYWVEMLLTVLALAVVVCALRRTRLAETIYSLALVGLISTILLSTEPLLSFPRRFILIFPIFMQLAIWSAAAGTRGRLWRTVSMATMLLLAVAFAIKQFIP